MSGDLDRTHDPVSVPAPASGWVVFSVVVIFVSALPTWSTA